MLPGENVLARFNSIVEFGLDLADSAMPPRPSVGIGKNRPSLLIHSAEGPACSRALPGGSDSFVESQHGQGQDGQKRDRQYQNVKAGEDGRKLHRRLRVESCMSFFSCRSTWISATIGILLRIRSNTRQSAGCPIQVTSWMKAGRPTPVRLDRSPGDFLFSAEPEGDGGSPVNPSCAWQTLDRVGRRKRQATRSEGYQTESSLIRSWIDCQA